MSDDGLGKFILDKLEKIDDKLDQVRIESAEARKSFDAHEDKDEDRHQDIKSMHDDIIIQVSSQNEKLSEYNDHLRDHMRRTELLEENQECMQDRLRPLVKAASDKAAVKTYFSEKWSKRIKILTVVSVTLGIIATLVKLFVI